ncbi:MAG: hypothetical protein F6K18_33125 [Okeania sp. SIO2C2]|uniref:hypothetical protein n=1 Tax=Okeania sp. SIO2C2 TaxID=2607787 RepID=UPI0013BC494F|nr:hypothetical protein [Okeania sp. SIO2C2]NEP91260.1 hypothetical protein [Okeania sp. SIO2C2]
MIESEILKKLEGTSVEERIQIVEAILQTLKHDMRSTSSQQLSSHELSLQGKVIYYEEPYEPVALEDWEKLA